MTTAQVMLWGTPIGTVAVTESDRIARFEYDSSFLQSGIELSPITIPLSGQVYSFPQLSEGSFHGLPGMLSDSLPDTFGNKVIDAWLEAQNREPDSMDPVERLCYTGSRGMGALEYVPNTGPHYDSSDLVQIDELVDLSTRIINDRKKLKVDAHDHIMQQIIAVGSSAGGARAKAIIALNEETGEIRSGQVEIPEGFEHWIIKFDGVAGNRDKEEADAPSYTTIEYAYYLMATAACITMSECRLLEEHGLRHFMTRRFDRIGSGPQVKKLHMQTLAALAHFDYMQAGSHSYEQAADIAYRIGIGQDGIDELFRRMVFNVMAQNQDDHVKNISFLMDRKGRWSFAPAYDVTYAYNPAGAWTDRHQMSINGKRRDIGHDDYLEAASHMNIRAARAKDIILQVHDAVSDWMRFAEQAKLDEEDALSIKNQFVL